MPALNYPSPQLTQKAQQAWTYVQVQRSPVRGPQPRLARGSGHTAADPALPGNASQLPGYLTDNEYFPDGLDYLPTRNDTYLQRIPRTINVGYDGLAALNPTYRAHDNTQADRFNHQMRRAPGWQVMSYPPSVRNLLAWKQVEKYQVFSRTLSARPLPRNNYFLGYQIDSDIASDIGGGGLGHMGSF